jgi:ketosteroid isomerase-like protein
VTDLIERLADAMNQHDLDGAVGLMHEDYRSEQPAHPGRAFVGRAQMRANWEAMFAGVPDFRADVLGSVQDGATAWTEWRWSGTRTDGLPLHMSGVTLFEIRDGVIVAGRLYMEDVELEAIGIADAVQSISGQQPRSVTE